METTSNEQMMHTMDLEVPLHAFHVNKDSI